MRDDSGAEVLFRLAPLFQKSDPAKSEIRKKRNLFFFVSPFFPSFAPFFFRSKRQNDIFDRKKGPFDQKKGPPNNIFCHFFGLFFFDQKVLFLVKRSLFSIKKLSLFSSTFSPFFIMVSVDHISFPSAGTGPLHIKWPRDLRKFTQTNLFLSFFRQTGTGPRPTHCGPQGKFELCVQRADSTSDHCHCH